MVITSTNDPQEFEKFANECLYAGREGAILHTATSVNVWTGQLDTLNRRACLDHELFVGTGQYLGGTIVNMPGDLSVVIATWGSSEIGPQIVDRFAKLLEDRGIDIAEDENDILADGKKVISWARATTVKGWCQTVVHFSIGKMDLSLVQEICTKPMKKVPGALSDYNILAADCEDIVLECLAQLFSPADK